MANHHEHAAGTAGTHVLTSQCGCVIVWPRCAVIKVWDLKNLATFGKMNPQVRHTDGQALTQLIYFHQVRSLSLVARLLLFGCVRFQSP